MLETFPAALVFALLVAVAMAGLYAVTVVPVVLALAMAERRGFSEGRWAALTAVGVLVGLLLALALRRADASPYLSLIALGTAFLGPLLVWVLEPGQRLGGRSGRHQPPL